MVETYSTPSPSQAGGAKPYELLGSSLGYRTREGRTHSIPRSAVFGALQSGKHAYVHYGAVTPAPKLAANGLPENGKIWYDKATLERALLRFSSPSEAAEAVEAVREWCAPVRRKIHVVANPASGNGKGSAAADEIARMARVSRHTVRVVKTTRPGDATKIASTLDLDDGDVVAAVGGDGTMCEVLEGLMARSDEKGKWTVCYVPAGTANAMANMTGHGDTATAIVALLNAQQLRATDIFSLEQGHRKQYGMLSVTSGFIADVDIDSEACRCCGSARFFWYAVAKLFCCCCCCCGGCARHAAMQRSYKVRWQPRGGEVQEWSGDAQFIQVVNAPAVDEKTKVSPAARLNDGLLHLTWSEPASRCAVVGIGDEIEAATHLDHPRWHSHCAEWVEFFPESAHSRCVLDGEDREAGVPFTVRSLPAHVNVVVSGSLPAYNSEA